MKHNLLLVNANFYDHISSMLITGAVKEIEKHQDLNYDILNVSGALEIPSVINMSLHGQRKYDGYIALGCVIRGETTHYDMVCEFSFKGLSDLAIKHNLAIGYGLLTVENEAQALVRADINQKNKGGFAVNACLELIKLKEYFYIY
ncbi:6,7-dimethyl-8-ribityllumazine synthase [Rickettsiales endosymbiont of Stachyamoeba lipophora]|uniref:6,7-dimethyl-8-ribityllumazine synthase n=1 Tax=Rickettsiales endosymbiont of Stachyamoeba lipophora TaxID=2486578 RepID=UPI000F64F6EE|nr:6,7-dimethyl-8-ribityllumazine synthase [Rickettsiales endosymbiont of Stachyamoeba lipophora]AZL15931.1 6,7-dimethyl-8-ribityllumazine synthase [Rickettsiales endosymbiont of Stachyamoeba lipophora]